MVIKKVFRTNTLGNLDKAASVSPSTAAGVLIVYLATMVFIVQYSCFDKTM